MRAGSLFSGVGGLDLGLARAGWEHVFFCESDPFRRRVLGRHWPGVPVYEDVCVVGRGVLERNGRRSDDVGLSGLEGRDDIGLLCGGFPCQDLSVAGRRAGLAGTRSSLFFEFARVADALLSDGGWVLIENVPGLLSSNGGRDFAVVLATLAELGFHDLAWRVLDSRYFGVPQRRRRVFIVGRRASGRRACEVLLEPEGGGGDFATGREARTGTPDGFGGGAVSTLQARKGRTGDTAAEAIAGGQAVVADSVRLDTGSVPGRRESDGEGGQQPRDSISSSDSGGFDGAAPDPDGVRTPPGDAGRLDGADGIEPRFVTENQRGEVRLTEDSFSLNQQGGKPGQGYAAVFGTGIRGDVTPFDPKPDGPRYAACGDAVTASVAEWIGRRIIEAEAA